MTVTVYNTIIKPHFEYSTAIQLIRIQKFKNKKMRVILKCERYLYLYKYNAIGFEMDEYKTKITVQYLNVC